MRLDETDRHRVQAAIQSAEAKSGVHIAIAIVPASDRYALYPLLWAAFAAFGVAGIVAVAWPVFTLTQYFAMQAAFFVLLSILFDWWPLRLALVPRHVRHARASQMAHREFAVRVLAAGKGGLLLFVSLGERYAEILADRTLHTRLGQPTWDRLMADLVAAAASRRLGDGVVKTIESCVDAITSSR